MARAAAKAKSDTANDERLRIIDALKFAAVAVNKEDNSGLSQFVAVRGHALVAENETFSVGVPVAQDFELCLHAEKFRAALEQCGSVFQMVQLSAQELSIKSGNFRAIVPVLPVDTIAAFAPDPPAAAFDNKVIEGLKVCLKVCSGKGERLHEQSVLLRRQTIIATNGAICLEYFHGFDFPEPMAIPRKTVETLAKIEKRLVGFGFTFGRSLTFYFEDNSFLKTRILTGQWPDVDKLFAENMRPGFVPLWKGFGDALAAVNKFVDNDTIYFQAGVLSTGPNLEHAPASYLVENLPAGHKFSAAYWRIAAPLATRVLVAPVGKPFAFASDNVRGLIIGKH